MLLKISILKITTKLFLNLTKKNAQQHFVFLNILIVLIHFKEIFALFHRKKKSKINITYKWYFKAFHKIVINSNKETCLATFNLKEIDDFKKSLLYSISK